MQTYSPTLDSRRHPLTTYDDYMPNKGDQTGQTSPAYPSGQADKAGEAAKKFEVAKDSAFKEGEKDSRADSLANNDGPKFRGAPIGGAAQGATPEARPDKAT